MSPDSPARFDRQPQVPARMPTDDVATVLEAYVERVARLVLHAQSLAERFEAQALPSVDENVGERLRALRDAVSSGQRAIVGAVRYHVRAGAGEERRSGRDRRMRRA